MQIKMAIANGYKAGEISGYIEMNAGLSPIEATEKWVRLKYGRWIDANLDSAGYTVRVDDTDSFVIDFDDELHALTFRSNLGGHVLEATNG